MSDERQPINQDFATAGGNAQAEKAQPAPDTEKQGTVDFVVKHTLQRTLKGPAARSVLRKLNVR